MNVKVLWPKSEEKFSDKVFESNKFKKWITNLDSNFIVDHIKIIKVHMFGENVGFIHLEVVATDKLGNHVPGIAFIRGDSVSILTVLTCEATNEKFVIFTNQGRIPVGMNVLESPAGMIDEGEPSIKAIEELKEEVGADIDFSTANLFKLTSGFTSPGGIDERIDIYAYEITLSSVEIKDLQGLVTGNGSENEFITLEIVPFNEAIEKTESIITKLALYEYINKKG